MILLATDLRLLDYIYVLVKSFSSMFLDCTEKLGWLDRKSFLICVPEMLTKLHDKKSGFLVNDELKIVVEVDVLKVIGKLDVSE